MKQEFTPKQIQELDAAYKDKNYSQSHRKIQVVLLRAKGKKIKEIVEITGYSDSTIWRFVKNYQEKGLDYLTAERRGGRHRANMTIEQEKAFLEKQIERAVKGELVTVKEMYEDYQNEMNRPVSKFSLYKLLERHNWRKITPRPEHPKKADAQEIEASKNKISIP